MKKKYIVWFYSQILETSSFKEFSNEEDMKSFCYSTKGYANFICEVIKIFEVDFSSVDENGERKITSVRELTFEK